MLRNRDSRPSNENLFLHLEDFLKLEWVVYFLLRWRPCHVFGSLSPSKPNDYLNVDIVIFTFVCVIWLWFIVIPFQYGILLNSTQFENCYPFVVYLVVHMKVFIHAYYVRLDEGVFRMFYFFVICVSSTMSLKRKTDNHKLWLYKFNYGRENSLSKSDENWVMPNSIKQTFMNLF